MTHRRREPALIIAAEDDLHAIAVRAQAEALGEPCLIIDSADFPEKLRIEHCHRPTGTHCMLEHPDRGTIVLADVPGIWWRRPQPYRLRGMVEHPALAHFAADECRQAFLGALQAVNPRLFNDPGASRNAALKLPQLELARACGLTTPRTLVTNRVETARAFLAAGPGKHVYKTFTGCDFGFYETRAFDPEQDNEALWRIGFCPAILQECIDGQYDVRVTVVGSELFAVRILFRVGRHQVDGRIDRNPMVVEVLPRDMRERLLNLVRRLGLTYAAIDLRWTGEDYVFFEVNPEGQYLWTEIETGLAISRTIAATLLGTLIKG